MKDTFNSCYQWSLLMYFSKALSNLHSWMQIVVVTWGNMRFHASTDLEIFESEDDPHNTTELQYYIISP